MRYLPNLIVSLTLLAMVHGVTPVYGHMVAGLFGHVSSSLDVALKAR